MTANFRRPVAMLLVVALALWGPLGAPPFTVATAQHSTPTNTPVAVSQLPPVRLDALDPAQWSVNSLGVAVGQQILVTNRGVKPHTFTVAEWGVDVELPTLKTVAVTVPRDVKPGETFTFYSAVANDRANGQEGTITILSTTDALATATAEGGSGTPVANESLPRQVNITVSDDFAFKPSRIDVMPGQFIQITNTGVLEHHFVVDEWNVNVTVSPGTTSLVQVPGGVTPGQTFVFYCSVPGHREKGEEGVVTIVAGAANQQRTNASNRGPDFNRFIPDASLIGPEWREVRTGNARAIVPELANLNVKIFPGEGRGAAYTGPNGSRAAVVVLPFAASAAPANQIDDAISAVQSAMMASWETDNQSSARYDAIPNPSGCDVANRIGGVTNLYTLPAGSTACQLRNSGIVIFVVVEGEVGTASSVEASDLIVERVLQHAIATGQ